MKIFAISDIHGSPAEFEEALELVDLSGDNMLILCGDYVHGYDSYTVLDRIMGLQEKYGNDKVIAIMGNHEEMVMNGMWPITEHEDIECDEAREDKYISWMYNLPAIMRLIRRFSVMRESAKRREKHGNGVQPIMNIQNNSLQEQENSVWILSLVMSVHT